MQRGELHAQSREQLLFDRSDVGFGVKLFEHFRSLTYELSKNPELSNQWSFLRYYQKIIKDYFYSVNSGSRGLLVNLPPGMGKTLVAVAVAMDHLNDKFPIILASKSLHINFITGIKKYIKMRAEVDPTFAVGRIPDADLDKWIAKNFGFVSMNASNMMDQMIKESEGQVGKEFRKVQSKIERKRVKEGQYKAAAAIGSLDGKFLIVDEAHNLFRSITNGSKNGIDLYNMIMHSHDLKIIFLTGTMPVNDPFEYVPCFNMLSGGNANMPLFPESYSDFRRAFILERKIFAPNDTSEVADTSKLTMINKDKFQNRIYGLVSHVGYNTMLGKGIIDMSRRQGEEIDFSSVGLTGEQQPVNFPKVLPMIIKYLPMSTQQYSMYMIAKNKEAEEYKIKRFRKGSAPIMQKPKSMSASTYKQKSRQMGNFAPPSSLGLVKFSAIDVDNLSAKDINETSGVKLEELRNFVEKAEGIGYVYSQFVGAGGLGSIMKYLELHGWKLFDGQKKLQTGKGIKKSSGKITTAIASDFEDAIMKDSQKTGGNDGDRIERFMHFMDQFYTSGGACIRSADDSHKPINIYFIVNGQTDLCADDRQIGASDVHLNKTGKKQAKQLAKIIKSKNIINLDEIDDIVVASVQRTHDVFNIVQKKNKSLNMDDVIMSDKLRPRNGGILDGLKESTVKALLDETGNYPCDGIALYCTKNDIMDAIDNILLYNDDDVAGNVADLTGLKDKLHNNAPISDEEIFGESDDAFSGRVKNQIDSIISHASKKLSKNKHNERGERSEYNVLIMAPNSVFTEAVKLITGEKPKGLMPTDVYKLSVAALTKDKTGGEGKQSHTSINQENDEISRAIIEELNKLLTTDAKYNGGDRTNEASAELLRSDSDRTNEASAELSRSKKTVGKTDDNVASEMQTSLKHSKVFAYYSGEVDVEDRENIRKIFNDISNADGSKIRLLLISSTGAEGLDLENARYGIVYEPYWVWSRNKQVFARGVRHNSHIHQPKSKQTFQPVLFIAVSPLTVARNMNYAEYTTRLIAGRPQPGDDALLTTDLELYIESMISEDINSQFSQATAEVSIECVLNGEHSCRMCAPTSSKLFGNDFEADMRKPNSCEKYEEELIEVNEIVVDGVSYYYSVDKDSVFGYKLFEYDSELGNYREMEKSNELYSQITDKISMK